jgi:hypothetical protein
MTRGALLCLVFACSLVGCGPSLRRTQQSRVYFERCYAADFDARIPLAEKHACWTAWLAHYTIGQPAERREYARDRVYAIEHGESVPRLPGLPAVAIGPRTAAPVTAVSLPEREDPAREDSAAPPQAPPGPEIVPPRPRRPPPLPRTTNPACAASACQPRWLECVEACTSEACETACAVELTACARGCF